MMKVWVGVSLIHSRPSMTSVNRTVLRANITREYKKQVKACLAIHD